MRAHTILPAMVRAVVALGALSAGCTPPPGAPTNPLKIGVLLPYTGGQGALGSNIEHALIMVRDAVNNAGGIRGQQVKLVFRDTHSSTERGMESARDLLVNEQVVALISSTENELAGELLSLLATHDRLAISGGVTSPSLVNDGVEVDNGNCFLRTSPTTLNLGRAVADRISVHSGARSANIVYVNDENGRGFARAVHGRLMSRGVQEPCPEFRVDGGVVGPSGMSVTCQAFEDEGAPSIVGNFLANNPADAHVLAAYPNSGAALMRELLSREAALTGWYASPDLRSEAFLQNVPPGSMEGLVGVSYATPVALPLFESQFSARWNGEKPMITALFYYDALALLLLGLATSPEAQGTGCITLREQVIGVSYNRAGLGVGWQEIENGLELIRQGKKISYLGVSSNAGLSSQGYIAAGLVQFWKVQSDGFVDTEKVSGE